MLHSQIATHRIPTHLRLRFPTLTAFGLIDLVLQACVCALNPLHVMVLPRIGGGSYLVLCLTQHVAQNMFPPGLYCSLLSIKAVAHMGKCFQGALVGAGLKGNQKETLVGGASLVLTYFHFALQKRANRGLPHTIPPFWRIHSALPDPQIMRRSSFHSRKRPSFKPEQPTILTGDASLSFPLTGGLVVWRLGGCNRAQADPL